MKKLVIIGANNFQLPLIKKAKELGLETHVFAWEKGALGRKFADHFYPITITEKERILGLVEKIQPQGIISIASDLAIITVNYIATHMKLIGNSPECTRCTTNKYAMRECLSRGGLSCPKFTTSATQREILDACGDFPLIVKPLDRSGSRGVTKVGSGPELEEALARAKAESFISGHIVEQFIVGREYSVEMISWRGEHHFLQVTEKETSGEPYFVEKAHHQPAPLSAAERDKIIAAVKKALTCLGVEYGASHSEVLYTNAEQIYIVEIGARMGGDYIGSHLVELSTGYDYLKGVIDIAMGKFTGVVKNRVLFSGIQYVFAMPGKLCKVTNKAKKYPEIVLSEVYPRLGGKTREIRESNDRAACYIYQSASRKFVPQEEILHLEAISEPESPLYGKNKSNGEMRRARKEKKHLALEKDSTTPRVLILGAGVFQIPLIQKAKAKGFETLVASVAGKYPGIALANRFFDTDIIDTEGILALARENRISAIITTGTDTSIPTIGTVVDALGLIGPSRKLAETVSWKTSFRAFMLAHGLNNPAFARCLTAAQAWVFYRELKNKMVMKPDDASGSRGVTILDQGLEIDAVERAFQSAWQNSKNRLVCAEAFIEGREVGGDAFFQNGKLIFFTTTCKHMDGLLVRGHSLPGNLSASDLLRVRNEIAQAAEKLGYLDGPMNFDVIVNEKGAFILELGLRNGGNGIVDLILHSEGVDLAQWSLDYAMGIPIAARERNKAAAVSSYVFGTDRAGILKSVTGLTALQKTVPQVFAMILAKEPGDEVGALEHNANLVGYLLIHCGATDYEKMCEKIRAALRVEVE